MARHTLWSSTDRDDLLRRFEHLSPHAQPKWGRLDAPRMVTHVTDAVRSSLGELTLAPKPSPLKFWPINTIVMFYLPWPKGVPTAPELLTRKPAEWTTELATLRSAITRFVSRDIHGPWTPHVAFGKIDGRQWGRLTYRHMDYHLGQFGG
jgi:hypothetical protein